MIMDVKVLAIFLCLYITLGTGEDAIPPSSQKPEYVWKPYRKEVYPLVRKAFKDIASSDSKIAIFFHYFNGPVIPGLHYTGELNYSYVPEGGYDFYYDWSATPVDESLHIPITVGQSVESLYTTLTDQSIDESLYTTLASQSADELVYTTVADQSADESVYTIVTDESADDVPYATVADQSADEMLYTTIADQSADESVYTTLTDQSTDESVYTFATEESVDEAPFATVTDQPAGESLYTAETDQSADEYTTVTDQSVDEALYATAEDDTVQDYHNTIIEDRVGQMPEELLEHYAEEAERVIKDSATALLQEGPIKGVPGVNYPVFHDFPKTVFTCSDKKYIPGIYADVRSGCQVFHVCYEHRMESFLCPVGTTFNQALLSCDYWYSSDCSLAPEFYDVNVMGTVGKHSTSFTAHVIEDLVKHSRLLTTIPDYPPLPESEDPTTVSDVNWSQLLKFMPVKSKVVLYPESTSSKVQDVEKPHSGKKPVIMKVVDDQNPESDAEATVETVDEANYLQIDNLFQDVKTGKNSESVLGMNQEFANEPQVVARPKRNALRHDIESTVENISPATPTHPAKVSGAKQFSKAKKDFVPDIIMRAFETAGSVFEKDILPFTREVIDSSVKLHKSKKN